MLEQVDQVHSLKTATLRDWLELGTLISIVDIRPMAERAEWYIAGSIHLDVYDKLKQGHPQIFQGFHLDKTIPVVFYCNSGQSSKKAAQLFALKGYQTYSLEGGLKAWRMSWNTAEILLKDFKIIQCRRTGKGCLSYILISDHEALIVDASLDVEVYEQIIRREKCTLKYVVETHIHADHLSRSRDLSLKMKASLVLPKSEDIGFDYTPLSTAQNLVVGSTAIQTIYTPGHTYSGVSFLIASKVLLTGDTLFINGVGRPDLGTNSGQVLEKAKLLYQSVQHLLTYPDDTIVLPAHTHLPIDFDKVPIQSTVGAIKKLAFSQQDESTFIQTIMSRTPAVPSNYLAILLNNHRDQPIPPNSLELESGANRCAIQ